MEKYCIKFLSVFIFLFANQIFAQQKKLWSKIDDVKISNTQLERKVNIKKYQTFQLEISDFRNKLQNVPTKNSVLKNSRFKAQFPNEYGKMISFWIKEAPVMHPELAKKFPNNKSYIGIGVEDNSVKIRFSVNELGLHAMIVTQDKKVQYINPVTKDKKKYRIYAREDLSMENVDFQCFSKNFKAVKKSSLGAIHRPNDLKLRTYRLALAATAEYSQFHIDAAGVASGTNAQKKTAVMAAMTIAVTRMNSIFENDLSITMEIVANNENLIFLDSNTDPYTNNDGSAMLGQNQTTCDNVIGVSNYDIGHVLSTDGDVSRASLSSICVSNTKARGVTGSDNPTGDGFYFDFIIHEIGHQLGANHTFNGNTGNCASPNRNDATAVEPGSGSTLMGYARICPPQNVQQHSDLYFHAISIDEIWGNIVSGTNNCATITSHVTNLNIPTANAGNDFFIPKSTPYKLTGQGNDADGDQITFCWEQMNNGINSIPPQATDAIGTLYRSVNPSIENTRFLPRLNTVLDGNLTSKWEVTPSVARVLDFRLTVRDNNAEGGQIEADEMKVTVTAAGPFKITSQSTTDIVWNDGASETITWDVAGTTGNGINVSNVNILLSIDGGKTFPIILASNTPNDGSQNITVPNNSAPNCRIMIEAIGNIFYAVNGELFSIGEFTTECANHDSVDIPKNIPDNAPGGIISKINVSNDNPLVDVKVSVEVNHTWIGDVTLILESPQGTSVELISGECFGSGKQNMNAIFDDSASSLVCGNIAPAISGSIKPSQELSNFLNESTLGEWKLKAIDENTDDTGTLVNWSLELCTSKPLSVNDYSISNFLVYPNPSQGAINISFMSNHESVELNIYDMLGRKIKHINYSNVNGFFDEIINLTSLSKGIYLLQVKNGNHFSSKKIQIL